MLFASSATPALTVSSPTATTISFTVSTRKQRATLPAQVLHVIGLLLRLVIGLFILGLWWIKWTDLKGWNGQGGGSQFSDSGLEFVDSAIAAMNEAVQTVRWKWLAPVGMLTLLIIVRRGYTEESLVVLRGLGIQTTSSSSTYLATATTRFIPTTSIQDMFIHEAFRGFEIRFYLCVVVENEEDSVVVFPTILPKRAILEEVWRGTRRCLYEPGTKS